MRAISSVGQSVRLITGRSRVQVPDGPPQEKPCIVYDTGLFDLRANTFGSDTELEAITATGAKTVKIVKPYADTDLIYRKLEHAETAVAVAVGMDTDYVFGGKAVMAGLAENGADGVRNVA